jgi:hypothetical protein
MLGMRESIRLTTTETKTQVCSFSKLNKMIILRKRNRAPLKCRLMVVRKESTRRVRAVSLRIAQLCVSARVEGTII